MKDCASFRPQNITLTQHLSTVKFKAREICDLKSIQEVAGCFDGVKWDGNSFMALCPCHSDRKQSLKVSIGDNGGIVLHCHAGCKTGDILQRVGLNIQDIMPERETPKKSSFDFQNIVATYEYPNGTRKLRDIYKGFMWQHKAPGGEWVPKRGDAPHVLYRAGGPAQDKVYLVEGEKDADNVGRLGLHAVSSENGADKGGKGWYPAYTDELAGLDVVILPDNDDVGRKYMDGVAAEIDKVAKSVKVLDLTKIMPDLPDKGDISDVIAHLGPEATLTKLAELEAVTDEWVPFTMSEPDMFTQFGFYSVPDLTDEEKLPPEFIVDGMIPVGMTILAGAPKIRKSFLALQLAIAVATGNKFLGRDTKKCDVVYFDLEGSKSRISNRADRMSISIPRNVYITNAVTDKISGKLVDQLRVLHHQHPEIRLVIIDTLSRSRGRIKSTGGANAYDADVELLEPVQRMAIEENISLLFVHHHKKGASFMADSFEQMSGTMGISGSADCVLNLTTEGKRFDGKATLEYTPRDAVGGEMSILFDTYRLEWIPDYTPPHDLSGNPVCKWIIDNAPEPRKDAKFYAYDTVYTQAYHAYSEDAGNTVRKQVETFRDALFQEKGIAVQTGVPSHGNRGIRIMRV